MLRDWINKIWILLLGKKKSKDNTQNKNATNEETKETGCK